MTPLRLLPLLGILAACEPDPASRYEVIDGDTLHHVDGRGGRRIRLFGIDAPERGEPGFAEARDALADLVAGGIRCQPPPHGARMDRYGRHVAVCHTATGVDVGAALIERRVAREWLHYSRGYYGATFTR